MISHIFPRDDPGPGLSGHVFGVRAPQAPTTIPPPTSGTPTTSSISTRATTGITTRAIPTTSINTTPFFPDPTAVPPPSIDDDNNNERRDLTRAILEYLFLALALLIVACLFLRRYQRLRRTNQPLRRFFSPSTSPRLRSSLTPSSPRRHTYPRPRRPYPVSPPTEFGPDGTPLPQHYPYSPGTYPATIYDSSDVRYPFYASFHLRSLPSAYYPDQTRRTHGTGIDDGGRRLDGNGAGAGAGAGAYVSDHDGALGDKDVLPAYDCFGGPPKYVELEFLRRVGGEPEGRRREEDGREREGGAYPYPPPSLPLRVPDSPPPPPTPSPPSSPPPPSTVQDTQVQSEGVSARGAHTNANASANNRE
ncbi:hypothetical protein AMATHDRAFT_61521 [Amanita thiersii Skay4041]|uniref:Uncharacterized protein n=1 Tax=Amanita thiersii Skay4041 TaxID=703135 RepID=A0A2A9NR78_9AGAR|nr:hypothetical protein AMATHDRAFT_61521 [Amanita thiersii Skay4041]